MEDNVRNIKPRGRDGPLLSVNLKVSLIEN